MLAQLAGGVEVSQHLRGEGGKEAAGWLGRRPGLWADWVRLAAVQYLHGHLVVHRDLAARKYAAVWGRPGERMGEREGGGRQQVKAVSRYRCCAPCSCEATVLQCSCARERGVCVGYPGQAVRPGFCAWGARRDGLL
jgi:hypothetical protein